MNLLHPQYGSGSGASPPATNHQNQNDVQSEHASVQRGRDPMSAPLPTAPDSPPSIDDFLADDDVPGTQFQDLLLGTVADTFSHRHQPDDRRCADEDAQRGEAGSHLLDGQPF